MNLAGDSLNTGNSPSPSDSSTGVVATTSDVVQHNTSIQEETRFTDANFVQNDLAAIGSTNLSHLDETTTIIKFLQRPTEIWNSEITSGSMNVMIPFASNTGWAERSTIKTFDLPKDFMKGRKLDKLNNYEWFKADMVIRFMVNVNPFVAGRLWACFSPMENNLFDVCKCVYKSRAAITSYPGVEIDLQNNNAAELRIPWCSTYDAISLTEPGDPNGLTGYSIGKVHLFSISDMLTGDSGTTIPIVAYAWFENIELKGPTFRTVNVDFQAAGEAKGPISEVASKISAAGDYLSEVPVIGGIASSVSWISNLVGGVASIFGWSRPVKGSASDAIVNIPGRGFTNFKAEDAAVVLGMAADNSIAEKEVNFMETVDEMDIQHIAGRPALVSTLRWLKGSQPKAMIANQPVGPLVDDMRTRDWTIGSTGYKVFDLSLFEALGTRFALWRADLHYKISITRTPFHVGRLEVIFVPGVVVEDDEIPTLDSTNTWRHVLDMTEQNEVEFVIPYMHKNVMCRTGLDPSGYERGDTGPQGCVGSLVVRQLTPLSAPSTVSNFVQVNVWKWATNVCFACPLAQNLAVPPKPVSVALQGDVEEEGASGDCQTKSIPRVVVEGIVKTVSVLFQGVLSNDPLVARTVAFGEENTSSNTLNSACLVGGEMITNLRQATRAHRAFDRQITDNFLLDTNLVGGLGGYVGFCANMYAFYRGGLSYKLIPQASDAGANRHYVTTRLCQVYSTERISDGPEHHTFTDLTPFHEVQTPFYVTSRRALCNNSFQLPVDATDTSLGVLVRTDVPGGLKAYIGAKDDLTFGFLFGTPIYARTVV